MTPEDFQQSLSQNTPPMAFAAPLRALWWDARGDWEQAHAQVDSLETDQGMRAHAYLHRKQGDEANAAYWYHRAGRATPAVSLAEEWGSLLQEFLLAASRNLL
ncbi:MAG TPA: hypothetical protein VM554_15575 [Acidisarcina sp.]|nr:hypothetical protein [Acidisarcina sp.]